MGGITRSDSGHCMARYCEVEAHGNSVRYFTKLYARSARCLWGWTFPGPQVRETGGTSKKNRFQVTGIRDRVVPGTFVTTVISSTFNQALMVDY